MHPCLCVYILYILPPNTPPRRPLLCTDVPEPLTRRTRRGAEYRRGSRRNSGQGVEYRREGVGYRRGPRGGSVACRVRVCNGESCFRAHYDGTPRRYCPSSLALRARPPLRHLRSVRRRRSSPEVQPGFVRRRRSLGNTCGAAIGVRCSVGHWRV